jgi:hypothetical protein
VLVGVLEESCNGEIYCEECLSRLIED